MGLRLGLRIEQGLAFISAALSANAPLGLLTPPVLSNFFSALSTWLGRSVFSRSVPTRSLACGLALSGSEARSDGVVEMSIST